MEEFMSEVVSEPELITAQNPREDVEINRSSRPDYHSVNEQTIRNPEISLENVHNFSDAEQSYLSDIIMAESKKVISVKLQTKFELESLEHKLKDLEETKLRQSQIISELYQQNERLNLKLENEIMTSSEVLEKVQSTHQMAVKYRDWLNSLRITLEKCIKQKDYLKVLYDDLIIQMNSYKQHQGNLYNDSLKSINLLTEQLEQEKTSFSNYRQKREQEALESKNTIESYENSVSELKLKISSLEADLNDTNSDIKWLVEDKNGLEKDLCEYKKQNEELICQVQRQKENFDTENKKYLHNMQELTNRISSAKLEKEICDKELSELLLKNSTMEEKLLNMSVNLQELQNEKHTLQKQFEEFVVEKQSELEIAIKTKNELADQCQTQLKEIDDNKTLINELSAEKRNLLTLCNENENSMALLKNEIASLKNSIEQSLTKEENMIIFQNELADQLSKLTIVESELKIQITQLQNEKDALSKKCEKLENYVEELKDQAERKIKETELSAESKIKEVVNYLQQFKKDMEISHEKEIKAHTKIAQELDDNRLVLQTKVEEQIEQIKLLEKSLIDSNNKVNDLKLKLEQKNLECRNHCTIKIPLSVKAKDSNIQMMSDQRPGILKRNVTRKKITFNTPRLFTDSDTSIESDSISRADDFIQKKRKIDVQSHLQEERIESSKLTPKRESPLQSSPDEFDKLFLGTLPSHSTSRSEADEDI